MLHHPSALQVTDETADNGRFYNDDDFEVLNLDENFDECMYIDGDGGTDEFCCFFFDFACPPDCGDEDVPTEEECYGIEDDGGVHAGCCCAYSYACESSGDDGGDDGGLDDGGCPEDRGSLIAFSLTVTAFTMRPAAACTTLPVTVGKNPVAKARRRIRRSAAKPATTASMTPHAVATTGPLAPTKVDTMPMYAFPGTRLEQRCCCFLS